MILERSPSAQEAEKRFLGNFGRKLRWLPGNGVLGLDYWVDAMNCIRVFESF